MRYDASRVIRAGTVERKEETCKESNSRPHLGRRKISEVSLCVCSSRMPGVDPQERGTGQLDCYTLKCLQKYDHRGEPVHLSPPRKKLPCSREHCCILIPVLPLRLRPATSAQREAIREQLLDEPSRLL